MAAQSKLSYTVGFPLKRRCPAAPAGPENHVSFKRLVVETACWLTGGCTAREDIGYWVKGADQISAHYTGAAQREEAWTVELCVPHNELDWTHSRMRAAIVSATIGYDVDVNWVHVTCEPLQTLHFSVDEERMK